MRIILPEGSLNDSQEPEAAHTFKEEKILTEGGLFPIPGTDGNVQISE